MNTSSWRGLNRCKVKAYSNQLPAQSPLPTKVVVVEQDEVFTFVGQKKASLRDDAGGSRHELHCGMVR